MIAFLLVAALNNNLDNLIARTISAFSVPLW
jgi:hypothetical protein